MRTVDIDISCKPAHPDARGLSQRRAIPHSAAVSIVQVQRCVARDEPSWRRYVVTRGLPRRRTLGARPGCPRRRAPQQQVRLGLPPHLRAFACSHSNRCCAPLPHLHTCTLHRARPLAGVSSAYGVYLYPAFRAAPPARSLASAALSCPPTHDPPLVGRLTTVPRGSQLGPQGTLRRHRVVPGSRGRSIHWLHSRHPLRP